MIVSIFVFLLVLSILVIAHEFGHFVMARKAGIWVEEFGFGLPPRIWGKQIGETLFSINALPFGGFVKLHGEQEIESGDRDRERAFLNKNKRTRISVIVAGVIMNFLLGIFAFATVYSFSGIPRDTHQIKVVGIAQNSPALTSGLLVGDVIKKVDNQEFIKVDDFIKYVDAKKDQKIIIETQNKKLTLTPRVKPPEGEGPLGVTITTTEIYFAPVGLRPFYGIYYGFKEAVFWGETILLGLWHMAYGLWQGNAPKGVSGPVGIFAVTSEAAKSGILNLINFVGILSVNLAILNILPFPALDGGRLLFIGIETILGRKILPKAEAITHSIGMIILLLLLAAITFHDIAGLISAGSISGFLNSIGK